MCSKLFDTLHRRLQKALTVELMLPFRFVVLFFICTIALNQRAGWAATSFPNKPIKIVVYMAPGGLIDATTRRFTEVAKKYTDATFVVENKVGAGGIVAMKHTLSKPADGYTLMACTKSNLSKMVSSRCENLVSQFDWTALLMLDPECVITLNGSPLADWQSLVQDARQKSGQQIWVGPARGGLDHVTAMKIWERVGIQAKWIPYKSGGAAKAALLGGQGVAYVGNPRDASGNPKYRIAAVSADARLPQFPDVPTFAELGLGDLSSESMWRGFALKKGAEPDVLKWYDQLFRQVTDDPDWRDFWSKDGIDVVYLDEPQFRQIVEQDISDFSSYLTKLNIVNPAGKGIAAWLRGGAGSAWLIVIAILFAAGFSIMLSRLSGIEIGQVATPIAFATFACVILLQSTNSSKEAAGPNTIPILLATTMLVLSSVVIWRNRKVQTPSQLQCENVSSVLKIVFAVGLYLLAVHFLGYLVATGLFLVSSIYLLGVVNKWLISLVTTAWLLISYAVFVKLLFVPLPEGTLWQSIF